jgi:hypothetical protein
MRQPTIAAAICLAALALAAGGAGAGPYKCRLGGRILYQEAPCPPGSVGLPLDGAVAAPDAASASAARARAQADIAAAEAIRRREAREEAEREVRRAEAEKHARACARLLAVILEEEAEAPAADKKKPVSKASSERRKYLRECGPL